MFLLSLFVSLIGLLAAQLSPTEKTVTVSKGSSESEDITDAICRGGCNNYTCNLSNQNLKEFPVCLPSTVERLDLNFNSLTVIQDQDVVDFSNLKTLLLAHNQLTEILWESNVFGQLEILDLSNNQLSVAPKCIMLKRVKWLSLAGNPISHIPPFAFTCFPNLVYLNVSSTLIGSNSSGDIEDSAFALNSTLTQEDSLTSLEVLDLSDTYLRSVDAAWNKDLPNLQQLHINKMRNMEHLEGDPIKWFPHMEVLNCADSLELTYVKVEIFKNARKLKYLNFQNCRLTSFPHQKMASSSVTIDLSGNPLFCTCELSWLFSNPAFIKLDRIRETFCIPPHGDSPTYTLWSFIENTCPMLHKDEASENKTQDYNLQTTTSLDADAVNGSQRLLMTTTSRQQESGQHAHPVDTVTVFKTTVSDPVTKATKSSVIQETTTLFTGNGFTNDSTMSTTGVGELSAKYTITSTMVTAKRFTDPASTIQAGSGQPITDDTSNEEQSSIHPDYSDDKDRNQQTIVPSKMPACDYDGCRHLQIPCAELQLLKPCLCPGLSMEDVVPDPPYLGGISEITDTSAQVHWCSPNSVVETYQIVYQPEDGQIKTVNNIYVTMRQHTLYGLSPHTTYKVCVVAYNKKGKSEAENSHSKINPCGEFKTNPSYIMILALLCGLGGILLVIIGVLAVCLYKTCKGNMVNQYDTHLVSYKNPAFEYHLTIPSYH
ncbi:leucine-rich repeat neuronal protein 4 [Hyperolius riggenbachi]|uniref:leucine-rich repeat neuronal protein 4 n=1 Tax=Hyperolius riggenbachi TaxID=752182 RepID=UPI0035A2A2A9